MAVSYNRLWKLLVDKKDEQGRPEESLWHCSQYYDQVAPGRRSHTYSSGQNMQDP